jgi:hypothetical protein
VVVAHSCQPRLSPLCAQLGHIEPMGDDPECSWILRPYDSLPKRSVSRLSPWRQQKPPLPPLGESEYGNSTDNSPSPVPQIRPF